MVSLTVVFVNFLLMKCAKRTQTNTLHFLSPPLSLDLKRFESGSGVWTARERAFRRWSLPLLPLISLFLCFFDLVPIFPLYCWFCFRRTARTRLCSQIGPGPMWFQMVVESRHCKGQAWLLEKSTFWVAHAVLLTSGETSACEGGGTSLFRSGDSCFWSVLRGSSCDW